jgi:hypothetical protein
MRRGNSWPHAAIGILTAELAHIRNSVADREN